MKNKTKKRAILLIDLLTLPLQAIMFFLYMFFDTMNDIVDEILKSCNDEDKEHEKG